MLGMTLVLLFVVYVKNALLFAKRLQIMKLNYCYFISSGGSRIQVYRGPKSRNLLYVYCMYTELLYIHCEERAQNV